jgi:AAA+ ATPase superfamily predicted ATPase
MRKVLFSLWIVSSLFACKKEERRIISQINNASIDAYNTINSDSLIMNVGKFHNEALTYFYKSENRFKSSSSSTNINDIVEVLSGYFISLGVDKDTLDRICNSVKVKQINSSSLNDLTEEQIAINPANFVTQLENQNKYSAEFLWEIYDILDLVAQGADPSIIDEKVKLFKNKQFLTKDDLVAQYIFVNIFNSSSDYWNNFSTNSSQQSTKALIKTSSWVIINDGIGGIVGSIFGGVGSIVVSTVFSVWTNEQIKNPAPSTPQNPTKIVPPSQPDPRTIQH